MTFSSHKSWLGSGMLLLTALIWGLAFVAQSVAMDSIGPFAFISVRNLIGAAVLLPVLSILRKKAPPVHRESADKKKLVIGGILCGLALCVASCLQQIGISKTTVGKAGFITALYVVFVPICGLFFRRRVPGAVWFSVALAVVGLYFLCMSESFTVAPGDLYVAACAVAFTLHILIIDHFSPFVDGVKLSFIQFLVAGVVAAVPALGLEADTIMNLPAAWAPVLYAGVLSSGVAYTLQIIGQRFTSPVLASLILSLESVFAVLGGMVLLHQMPTAREMIGCVLMFAAIVLSQVMMRPKEEERV